MHTLLKFRRVCDIVLTLLEKETGVTRGLPISPKAQQVREKTTDQVRDRNEEEEECKRLIEQCFPEEKKAGTELQHGCQRNVGTLAFNDQSSQTNPLETLNSTIFVSKTTNKECNNKSEVAVNRTKDYATTAKTKEEKLVPKIEVLDEPKLIETDPKNDLVIHPPKLLGGKFDESKHTTKYNLLTNSDLDKAYDELAKRCLHAPDDKICEVLVHELSKFSVPRERQRLLVRRVLDERERNRPPSRLSYPFTTLTQFPNLKCEHQQDSLDIQKPNLPNHFNLTHIHLRPVEEFDFAHEVALATKISIEQLRNIIRKDLPTIQKYEEEPKAAKTAELEEEVPEISKGSVCVNDYCFNHPKLGQHQEDTSDSLKKTPINNNFVEASHLKSSIAANNFMCQQPKLLESNEDVDPFAIETIKLESPNQTHVEFTSLKGTEQFNQCVIKNTQGMVVSSVEEAQTVIPPQGLPKKIESLLLGQLPSLDEEDLSLNELLQRMRSRNKMIYLREQCFSNISLAPSPKGSCNKPCPPCKKPTPCPPPTPVCPRPQPPPPPACPPPKPCPKPCKPKCPSPCPPPCPPPKNPCLKFSKSTMTLILNWDSVDGVSNISLLVDKKTDLNRNLSEDLSAVLEKAWKSLNSAEYVTVSEDFETDVVGLRGKDYEPWVPIPCWPIPQKEMQRPLVCPKDGCQEPPPKLNPPCQERPCDGFPKRKFSLVNFMF